LPALGIVRNDISIVSSGALNCSDVPSSLARGSYSCNGNAADSITNSQTSAAEHETSGLSGGAIAGIVIGTLCLVAILAGVAFVLYRRHKRLHPSSSSGVREIDPAPSYQEHDKKEDFEMDYYSVQPHFDAGSQKELIQRSSEVGRPTSRGRPGPEGRHEMFNTKDPPAAHELAGSEVRHEREAGR
jgi:hypothetical protein